MNNLDHYTSDKVLQVITITHLHSNQADQKHSLIESELATEGKRF